MPTFTNHATARMETLAIALDDVMAALASPSVGTARLGCVNHWHRRADGQRIRVTYNPAQNVVVTVGFADRSALKMRAA